MCPQESHHTLHRQGLKQLAAMLTRTADGAWIIDSRGTVVYWNRAAERLLGYRAEEVLGRLCHEVICGQTLSGLPLCRPSCPIAARLGHGEAVRNVDLQARTKAGKRIWLNVSSIPVPTRMPGQFWHAHLCRDISKQAKVRQLVDELHLTLSNSPSPQGIEAADPPPPLAPSLSLSEREREVLRLLASGRRTRDIADQLCISPATVRNHIQHILEKLGAHTRLEALAVAYRPGSK
jgi:PAS domain S-box-containing protein